MFSDALLGHSLLPREFDVLPGVSVDVYRKPGGTWADFNSREFEGFRGNRYNLAILIFGGNDLAVVEPQVALQRAREFISKVKDRVDYVRVYTVEQREYSQGNRFRISTREYLIRRNR